MEESPFFSYGRLKFFDEPKSFGFIVCDDDGSDIFVIFLLKVHYDDLSKANISKEFLKTCKVGNEIKFKFKVLSYVGKYNKSRKAINLELIKDG